MNNIIEGNGVKIMNASTMKNKGRTMRGAVLYGPRDVRFEERDVPEIIEPTDAIIRIAAACVCGSDLWPYRGHQPGRSADPDGAASTAASSRR